MVNAAITARPASSQYIHGTHPDEQRRLSALNDHLNETSLAALAPRATATMSLTSAAASRNSRAIVRRVGRAGKVIGIERSAEQITEGRRQAEMSGESHLVDVRQGDALAMPLAEEEWGSFDVAHTRFLLEHVSDPQAVVDAMVRAVRPGGRIVLEDDDHDVLRLWPEPAGFTALMHAYARTYDRLGNDPYVGRRLVSLLHNAAQPRAATTGSFSAHAPATPRSKHGLTTCLASGAAPAPASSPPASSTPRRSTKRSPP